MNAFILMLMAIFLAMSYGLNTARKISDNKKYVRQEEMNTSIKRYVGANDVSIHYRQERNESAIKQKELVQKVLIRTCNAIYQKGILYRCPDAELASTVWEFVGDIGTEGSLYDAWHGDTTDTFACGDEAKYGRYLAQNAIPVIKIDEEGWGYDLSGVEDDSAYPCGYSEIVTLP